MKERESYLSDLEQKRVRVTLKEERERVALLNEKERGRKAKPNTTTKII